MKKNSKILLYLSAIFIMISCSNDDNNLLENETIVEDFQKRSPVLIETSDDAQNGDCQIIFEFDDPNITAAERQQIRQFYNTNHFTILGYDVIDQDTEQWYLDCDSYQAWLNTNGLSPSSGDIICDFPYGCIKIPSCLDGGCEDESDDEVSSPSKGLSADPGEGPLNPGDLPTDSE